ncbi:MAG TPA: hypothetical protein VFF58_00665 [Candidatus Nitrosotalea sp.]|nr:hypothetical protein [Candidatus Nitrosotalea sp.]
MRKLLASLLALLLLLPADLFAQQAQQPTRKLYVFTPPTSGGTSADEQIVVNVPNGSAAMTWCDMAGTCAGGPTQLGNNAFNPKFSTLWVNIPVLVNNVANTITSCASATACTLQSTVASGCSNFCTLRLTNFFLNEYTNSMLAAGSIFNGSALLADWDDIEMSGSIGTTNGSATVAFGTTLQHCQFTSACTPTAFAPNANWNGKQIKIADSSTPQERTFTLTNTTTLGSTFGGTTGTYLFRGLYDFTATDARIAAAAVNGKKVVLIVRPAASSGINISTPAFVTGTDYAAILQQTQATMGCTANTTINSNLVTFTGTCTPNPINMAGTLTVAGVTAMVINNCVPAGIWGYTTTTCISQTNASATATGANFTWAFSPPNVCFSVSYPGGLNGTAINGITYTAPPVTTCQNAVLGAAPLRTATNPTGLNYMVSFPMATAWQQFIAAVVAHYNGNANVDYIRFGHWGGGESFPFGQTTMAAIVPSATISDPPWNIYLHAAVDDQQNAAIQAASPTMTIDTSGNNCTGAGAALDFRCADLEFSDALSHGLTGFGSQGLSAADIGFYAGFPCSGNHCKWWPYISSCQPNAPFVGCNANIKTPFLLQVQQTGNADLLSFFYGPGTANPPVSAVRTNGQVVVTFTSDPTAGGANIKSDGSTSITMAGWDSSFNGTFQVVNSSAGAKTLTFNQPNVANATSATIGVVGEGLFGSWSITLPFEYALGTNSIELYPDEAAMLVPDPRDTYHSYLATLPYINGNTLGGLWTKQFTDYVNNAIH